MDIPFFTEFLTIVVVHFLSVVSPGPDFAIVVRQSLIAGKRCAIWTSLGIGAGILIHVMYSLLGIGLVISQSIVAFTLLKVLGAGYLIYIGIKSIQDKPKASQAESDNNTPLAATNFAAFKLGFITNALNPKAALFFVSLFSVIINPKTPLLLQVGYGLWMTLATALWFCFVSLIFSTPKVQASFERFGHWVSRATGGVLIALGIKLALSKPY